MTTAKLNMSLGIERGRRAALMNCALDLRKRLAEAESEGKILDPISILKIAKGWESEAGA